MEELKTKILLDVEINKKCLEQDIDEVLKKILRLWINYDEELLSIIRKVEIKDVNGSPEKSK